MGGWVSVNERMPDEDQYVVFASFYSWGRQLMELDAVVAGQFWNGSFNLNSDVLEASNYDGGACIKLNMNPAHWMPLPEQPKDGE